MSSGQSVWLHTDHLTESTTISTWLEALLLVHGRLSHMRKKEPRPSVCPTRTGWFHLLNSGRDSTAMLIPLQSGMRKTNLHLLSSTDLWNIGIIESDLIQIWILYSSETVTAIPRFILRYRRNMFSILEEDSELSFTRIVRLPFSWEKWIGIPNWTRFIRSLAHVMRRNKNVSTSNQKSLEDWQGC